MLKERLEQEAERLAAQEEAKRIEKERLFEEERKEAARTAEI